MNISIVVVTWNCATFIQSFISELFHSLRDIDAYEVLIYDNSSSDGTFQLLEDLLSEKKFELYASNENLGFAKANNILIQKARFNNIVLLNPDVFGYPEKFWELIVKSMEEEKADIGFVRLLNKDGSFQDCIGNFPTPSRAIASLLGRKKNFSRLTIPTQVDVGIMAFMITHKEVFDEIGLIDEDFHMYCEDVEWCFRATQIGKMIKYFPQISLTHLGGASTESRWKGLRKELIKYRSEGLFVRKHFHGIRFILMMIINLLKRVIIRLRIIGA